MKDNELVMTMEDLEEYISGRRKELIQIGMEKGLQNEETIQYSRELDYYLTLYQKHVNKN
ncbi:aspartyl-phosphate phosphatase Spo0E family protein [Bacillus tianshenii]|nr:aspartyl-phosphate phosphatase Spo0E family protein [Bacillus tianshenii]